jgi:heme-degrading monooxygenase HmoA
VIVEVGLFRIDRGRTGEFAAVAADIRSAFERGGISGLRSFRLANAVEDVGRWAVLVGWDSIADHERFVASDEGERQRGLLGQFITETPEVFHLSLDDLTEGLR